jgi:ArsR family transcriptional regulator
VTDKEKTTREFTTRVFKALAHPTRLLFVETLAERERCVCELKAMVAADLSTVSKHLSVLREAGIVEIEKRGNQVFYRLKLCCVMGFVRCMRAEMDSQVRRQSAWLRRE